MSKGQVTIPKKVRSALGINVSGRVTFVVDGNQVRVVDSALYAIEKFHEQVKGEAEKAGSLSEDDVAGWITQSGKDESIL